ncbi:hypothetical protein L3X38_032602 [Prunus dulcis]|uniref:Ubiquitin-like protease family profile domain-containing protein n=1 Tax=Prunus dulcis TaxID=3755 RepID=A0AAD4YW26_PRUDU|nr:hypothetical protein L3X38_032602 [Prunus dulcis]
MESEFELCFLEVYAAQVNNLCASNSVLCNFGAQFSESLMKIFRESSFGHLLGLHKIAFSGQIVHALALRRVGRLGVKDMLGLSYAIGSNVAQFSVKNFCLISGLKCGTEPDIKSRGDAHNRFMKAHFTNRGHITFHDLENAFLKSERGSKDSFKLGLQYFFGDCDNGRRVMKRMMGREKDIKRGKKALQSLVRKGKKNVEDEKPKRINRPGWSIKGLSYALQIWVYELIAKLGIPSLRYCKRIEEPALVPRICRWESTDKMPEFRKLNAYIFQSKQPVILHLLRPSQLEMSQPYWSWGSDVPECNAPSVAPWVCKDLDELNSVVQQLRNETGDAGEESQKTEDGGVAESRDQCVQNAKEKVQYTPPDINWDDPGVVCVTLVKFLTNPPRKIDMSTAEGEWDEDVIVGVRQKRGRGKSEILGPEEAKGSGEGNSMDSSHVRLCGEDGMEGSHNFFVRLLSKDEHKHGLAFDTGAAQELWQLVLTGRYWTPLFRSILFHKLCLFSNLVSVIMHNSCATMQKCAALDYKQMKAYVGKEDMQHNKGLLGMVKGKGPKLAKSWSSVNHICLPFNVQRQKHWILLVVDLKECEISAYDSKVYMCRTQAIQWAVQLVAKMLPRLLKESGYIGDGLLLKSEWPVICVMDAPQQVGGGDCGMYILKYYEFLTSNVDLAKVSHDAMPFYRLKLAVQLLQGYW